MTKQRQVTHAAIDLGASSARLVSGGLQRDRLVVREVRRVANRPVRLPDGLHWDLLGIHREMLDGLAVLARDSGGGLATVGVDGWGVDYGLLDADGRLLGAPFHYRDRRTAGRVEEADRLVGRRALYEATGIQEMPINTVYQLLAERESAAYGAAARLLLVPDLVGYLLTGVGRLERTNASTTQLVDARTGEPVAALFDRLGLRSELLPPPIEPGSDLGGILPEVAASVGLDATPTVVAVASHDTASAVLAAPAVDDDFAYVVSGTWALVGLELDAPVITEESRHANFSNELGVEGTVRFLRNVMGHWMLQELDRVWRLAGRGVAVAGLLPAAAECTPFRSVLDTADPRFAEPGEMPGLVREACARAGEPTPESDVELVRCVLDSMALAMARALEEAQRCAGRYVHVVHVVGGGAANELLVSLLASCTGIEVVSGPVEASSVGNLLTQIADAERARDRYEMRDLVRRSFPLRRVLPDPELARSAEAARRRLPSPSGAPRPPDRRAACR